MPASTTLELILIDPPADLPLFVAVRREDTREWWSTANGGGWVAERQPGLPLMGPNPGSYDNEKIYTVTVGYLPPGVLCTARFLDAADSTIERDIQSVTPVASGAIQGLGLR